MEKFDPDHALAILLQARFNEEEKQKRQKNKENLPVRVSKSLDKPSLIDPEWEVTDPCPDIHGLFLAFNDRFFSGRLSGVEVKWSPQMTSCAGICVYEGRNGLCSVRLSAPLLKLRPRSDLIETLLHEMIHAYLFVTNNNRDRDGHGPEFHKHMHRINKEAGTNITVYHSFHAEVKVYQQHWWRCNGPCQHRPPFFGMVKRAKNRAPSQNDLWWADHQAACGGQFIKVREPENYASKKKIKEAIKTQSGKDIRNFFKKPDSSNGLTTASNNKVESNVFVINNFGSKSVSETAVKPPGGSTSVNRVVGFNDLSVAGRSSTARGSPSHTFGKGYILGQKANKSPKGRGQRTGSTVGRGRGRGGMLANRGGATLVVTGSQGKHKPTENQPSPNTKLRVDNFHVFSGTGFTVGSSSGVIDRSRSRLLSVGQEPESKKAKLHGKSPVQNGDKKQFDKKENGEDICQCSICNERIPREEMDIHLERCAGLGNVFNNSYIVDVNEEKEINEINKKYMVTSCPVCALHVEGDINSHLDECLNSSGVLNMFDEPPIEIRDSESPVKFTSDSIPKPKVEDNCDIEIIEPENRVACPICGMRFGESRINSHVNQCLDSDDGL